MAKQIDPEIFNDFALEFTQNLETAQSMLSSFLDSSDSSGSESSELVNYLLRVFHSIKGASGFLGTVRLTEFAHKSENLVVRYRDARATIDHQTCGLLLEVCARLSSVFKEMTETGRESVILFDDLLNEIESGMQKDLTVSSTPDRPTEVKQAKKETGTSAVQSIRVQLNEVERLLKLSSELTLIKNKLVSRAQLSANDGMLTANIRSLVSVTSQIQQLVMQFRLQKVDTVFKSLPRIVYDLSQKVCKEVELSLSGDSAELDKAIVEALKDPLIHLIRNSLDHGIESAEVRERAGKPRKGLLSFKAYNIAGWFVLEISDDGNGIDVERVKAKALQAGLINADRAREISEEDALPLIFEPGFSTRDTVSDLSGRGVGLDVVKSTVSRWGGRIEIKTVVGKGTTFKLYIPLTLAVVPSLIIESCGIRFAIPRSDIRYVFSRAGMNDDLLKKQSDGYVFEVQDGKHVPAILLREVFGLQSMSSRHVGIWISHQNINCVLVADRVLDFEDLVIKPINSIVLSKPMYSGASVLADGSVVYGLDPGALFEQMGISFRRDDLQTVKSERSSFTLDRQYLTFSAGDNSCWALPLESIVSIHTKSTLNVVGIDKSFYFRFRDQLIPATPLQKMFGRPFDVNQLDSVVVIRHRDQISAILVDKILDTHPLEREAPVEEGKVGISGIAEFKSRIAHIIDLDYFADHFKGIAGEKSRRAA